MSNNVLPQVYDKASAASIDTPALERAISQQGEAFYRGMSDHHAHLFSAVSLSISSEQFAGMEAVIAAVEAVVRQQGWSETKYSPQSAKGVFFGYDFHLNDSGVHLIEINTNAGGAFLNVMLLQSQQDTTLPGKPAAINNIGQSLIEMFRNEWRLEHGDAPLKYIAIVDEKPTEQYLYPEFILAQQLLEQAGIRTFIADPAELRVQADGVYLRDQKIDLVYNRLTDFSLQNYPALLDSYQKQQVVLTPSPLAYTRYADKQNLVRLSDPEYLRSLNVDPCYVDVLQKGIPKTCLVKAEEAERWWAERKQWFFKPMTGYGSKGAYRGDKITKRVFDEILTGNYVAQTLAVPGECPINIDGKLSSLKYDVRCYVYDGKIQLIAARLYQGQTTNFRTPGGGFGLVRIV